MDEVAHGRVVLSAIIAGRGSLSALGYATDKLVPPESFFTDPVQRKLFLMLGRYNYQAGGVMSRSALEDLLRNAGAKPGTALMFQEAYDDLATAAPEPHEFRHSVDQLRELAADRATGAALAAGMQIIRDGLRTDDGREWAGHAAAREYVLAEFAAAETAAGTEDSPGGDVTTEGDDILAVYARTKELRKTGKVQGIEFGLPELDRHLNGGLGHGELALVAAAMTAGKSSLCVQAAWHNAVVQGKNVLMFTTEQHRTALRIKIVARHSKHPKFGLPRGLDTRAIRSGQLGDEGERALAAVVADLKTGDYGSLQVIQMPEECTLSRMAARAEAVARIAVPDVVIIDYLQLFNPEKVSRESRQHETQAGLLKAARGWARSFRRGRGVGVISPWQVNNPGLQTMKSSGEFTLEHLSETIEAGRTPSMVLGLMTSEEDSSYGRAAPVELKVLKDRDGPRGRKFPLTADFATCHFTDRDMSDEDPIDFET